MAFANDACKVYPASVALAANLVVQLNTSAQVVVCAGTASDQPIGVTFIATDASNNQAVFLLGGGIATAQAAAVTISIGNNVYTTAAGQVSNVGTGKLLGIAATATTGTAGQLLDFVPGAVGFRNGTISNFTVSTYPLTLTAGTAISLWSTGGLSNLIYMYDSTFASGTAQAANSNSVNLAGAINALRSAMLSSTLFS